MIIFEKNSKSSKVWLTIVLFAFFEVERRTALFAVKVRNINYSRILK